MKKQPEAIAMEWINTWNSHDINDIMSHYSEKIKFSSPIIKRLQVNDEGVIRDKKALQLYFEKGLNAFPDLKFELIKIFEGIGSMAIYYTSVNNMKVVEYLKVNDDNEIIEVNALYENALL